MALTLKYMQELNRLEKEGWINADNLEQRLVVTYSIKYKDYPSKLHDSQVAQTPNALASGVSSIKKHCQNDYKRFIEK